MPSSPTDRDEAVRLEKKEVRRHFRALRHSLSPKDRHAWDRSLCEQILTLPCYRQAQTILAYYPIGDEPDLRPVLDHALAVGKTVAFPVCDPATCTMIFRAVRALDELAVGAYGIHEPIEACPSVSHFDDALCLVPALAFDRRGFRIGYGKGYYDRFLAAHPVDTLGATYSALIADALPCEPTDRAVSTLLTERGMCFFNEEYRTQAPKIGG